MNTPASTLLLQPAPARLWLGLRMVALALFLFLTCGPSVMAEGGDSSTFFLHEQPRGPMQRLRQNAPAARRAVVARPWRRSAPPAYNPPSYTPSIHIAAPVPEKPAVPPSFVTLVIGDSLGVLLAQGLAEAYADRPEIGILRKARESSGLVRDDFYDWGRAVNDLLAGPDHIDVAVMMIGSNDRQEMPDRVGTLTFRTPDGGGISPEFLAAYGNRVEALAAKFKEKHIPLIWVGMPVMKNDRMSAELAQFNEIYRERAAKAGAVYVDVWEPFLNDTGKFDAFGPDLNGEVVKLRSADGVHFTKSGARKLAHFVEGDIKRILDQVKPASDPLLAALPQATIGVPAGTAEPAAVAPAPAAPAIAPAIDSSETDLNALLRRQMGEPAAPKPAAAPDPVAGLIASLPLPAELPPLFLPVRPLAGPVFLLTAQPLSPTGELVGRTSAKPAASEAQAMMDQAFIDGRLAKARPGRADNFAWPQK